MEAAGAGDLLGSDRPDYFHNVEPKKAKMEKYSSPPTVTQQNSNNTMTAGGLNASTRSSSPVELSLHGMERDKDRATYLQQLIKDQKCCLSYPNVFHHVERLLSEGKYNRVF